MAMNIRVIDAFGTTVGDATVIWRRPGTLSGGQETDDQILAQIFPELTIVAVPTRNQQLAWSLEITP